MQPGLHQGSKVVGVHHLHPRVGLRGVKARIRLPLPRGVFVGPLRVGRPDEVGQGFGQGAEALLAFTQGLFSPFLLVDVGGRAHPPGDGSIGVNLRNTPTQVPPVRAVAHVHAVLVFVYPAGGHSPLPGFKGSGQVVGMHDAFPVPLAVGILGGPGKFRNPLVVVRHRAVRLSHPDHLRHGISQSGGLLLAFGQGLFIPDQFGYFVPYRNDTFGLTNRIFQRLVVDVEKALVELTVALKRDGLLPNFLGATRLPDRLVDVLGGRAFQLGIHREERLPQQLGRWTADQVAVGRIVKIKNLSGSPKYRDGYGQLLHIRAQLVGRRARRWRCPIQ